MIAVEKFKSGTYRNNGDFKSFIPTPINDTWTWSSPEINSLLSQADREIGALSSYSEFIPDLEIYIRMHIRVEANKSNRIEGTRTSIEEDMLPKENLIPEKRDANGNIVQQLEKKTVQRVTKKAGSQYSLRYQEVQAIENAYLRREIETLKSEIKKLKAILDIEE